MSFATRNTSAFPLFRSLPPELRDQIWRSALPDELGPSLYFYSYQKRCWGIRPLSPADAEWGMSPSDDGECRKLEFCHKLLDSTEVEVPLFYVNREARNIAQTWIYDHGLEVRVNPSMDTQLHFPFFVRSFDPAKDTLYVPFEQSKDFLCEPHLRLSGDDLVDRFYHHWADNLIRIAMPERIFQERHFARDLAEMIRYDDFLVCVKVLYIIVDTPSELHPANNNLKIQPGWKLEEIQGGGAFIWDHQHGQFNYNRSEQILSEDLEKLFERITNTIGEQIINDSGRSFEVRPVFAARA